MTKKPISSQQSKPRKRLSFSPLCFNACCSSSNKILQAIFCLSLEKYPLKSYKMMANGKLRQTYDYHNKPRGNRFPNAQSLTIISQ